MYAFPEMIELGLESGKQFPTPAHRKVAVALAIGNPNVTTCDCLIAIINVIITIPEDRIKTITPDGLRKEFADGALWDHVFSLPQMECSNDEA